MGFLSSSTPEPTPDLTKKSARKVCWESKDKYFACLDKHNILDPRKDPATALSKCKGEDAEFTKNCVKSWGVTKIRLTGGEPTLRRDLVDLMEGLHSLPGLDDICITSNGLALHRKLPALAQHGLTALNLSLDTLVPAKFELLTRRPGQGLAAVLRSLDTAVKLNVPRVKLNVVVMRGVNDDEILDFVALARDHPIQIRFIEYMPFDGNRWNSRKMVPYAELRTAIERGIGVPLELIPARPGDTAKNYRLPESNYVGSVGFITSMTDHFCGSCTRLRLTSDGNLKVCLFDNAEVSLRDRLRAGASDAELLNVVGAAVRGKKSKHAGLDELEKMKNRPMVLIGG